MQNPVRCGEGNNLEPHTETRPVAAGQTLRQHAVDLLGIVERLDRRLRRFGDGAATEIGDDDRLVGHRRNMGARAVCSRRSATSARMAASFWRNDSERGSIYDRIGTISRVPIRSADQKR